MELNTVERAMKTESDTRTGEKKLDRGGGGSSVGLYLGQKP